MQDGQMNKTKSQKRKVVTQMAVNLMRQLESEQEVIGVITTNEKKLAKSEWN